VIDFSDPNGNLRVIGNPVRDEAEQADYVTGLLELLDREGADSAFVYTFASRHLRGDLDIGSLGVVRALPLGESGTTFPQVDWEPKEAFYAMADLYGKVRGRSGL